MYILGLTTMGDAAACLIKDGELIAAAEEERFSRIKHHVGFPYKSVEYVLSEADIQFKEVDHIGLYWKPWVVGQRILVTLNTLPQSWAAFNSRRKRGLEQVGGHYKQMFFMQQHLKETFGDSKFKFHYLSHHLCHAASCFFVSPFDHAAIFTVDGTGEDCTTLCARGEGSRIHTLDRIKLPHSLGQFYSAMTNFLGFDMFQGDEWKMMGLAGWGKPEFYDYFIDNILIPIGKNKFHFNTNLLDHHLAKDYIFNLEFMKVVGPNRKPDEEITQAHRNLAATAQRVLEDIVIKLLNWLYEETQETNLCMAGGVAFNSLMNGRIMTETPFKNFYFQPAAGDSGCALGACYQIWNSKLNKPRNFVMNHAYWGPGFSDAECQRVLDQKGLKYEHFSEETLVRKVAQVLAEGYIVAWFQGRMEWGPRALGNRSFIANPTDPEMREKLNHQVKLREWFRPLAPSMLEEASCEIFGTDRYDPFMITVFPVVEDMRAKIPAVVHIDGTARPQTVRKEINPRYWKLIKEFECLTGIPCLLNTSFNIQEPIVCTPEDAVNTFLKSQVRYLVLGGCLIDRDQTSSENKLIKNFF
ncbi:carbamoyltransferase family protein [Laspinema olomoucense]|uniref:Carbamoyltransferase n=1 Tax=Laspinema olomoucense D3b TaxID=2953688 RepID=A0ABT2N1G0_9CYAN|nr:carbamoyltransferase C-terminal domain-containing protein [Laspinema sp. D3b]MCT7976482.1 hypothetical protein [Laspinema sp. D3b]